MYLIDLFKKETPRKYGYTLERVRWDAQIVPCSPIRWRFTGRDRKRMREI